MALKVRKIVAKPVPVSVQLPAPIVVAAKPKRVAAPRITHEMTSLYAGASPGLNRRKSRTVLDLASFGSTPDYVLPERTELVAETIKAKYGNKPFPRANLDAGVLKHLGYKGYLDVVSGNGGEDTILRITKSGMAHHRKTA